MQIAAAGDRALLVTIPETSAAVLRAVVERLSGFEAAIIGHESILVIGTTDEAVIRDAVEGANRAPSAPATQHTIEVSFAREHALDIDALLEKAGADRESVIARIAATPLTVRYLGFRGGFAYLDGWPEEWALPRRPTSRNVVPGGSFAIGGAMAGFYPADLPGGWNVIGRTDALPQLLPGDEIRIAPVDRPLTFPPATISKPEGEFIADVLAPGQLTTVVTARNAFDREAASLANAAAGNAADAPLLECVLVGPRLLFHAPRRVAWCGPDLNARSWIASEVDIGRVQFRGWLAIEGGVSALGKALWSGGQAILPVPTGRIACPPRDSDLKTLHIKLGPHDAPPLPEEWLVTPHLNRVGIRLQPLGETPADLPKEMKSCGMQFGTLQWHPDGSLMAMGPDHPVTGGYLQPATVISTELWKLAQLAPGERVRLLPV